MRNSFRAWMLPEGVVEALPDEATKLNALEQTALSTFSRWGYQLLRPPMMEYADTFIADDQDGDLTEQTIQFKDQKSGKQLGFRADITPQIARIDAHYLRTENVARYAYVGEVVRSYPTGHGGVRNPSITGVELLGSRSWQADVEIVSLLIEYLKRVQLPNFIIELGSIDIVAELLKAADIDEKYFSLFFDALSRKDNEKLIALCEQLALSETIQHDLCALTSLYGDREILRKANVQYRRYPMVISAIGALTQITEQLQANYPSVTFNFDLSDVHGYGYHNGLIFSAYVHGLWQSVARGGRYDGFGNDFGEESGFRPSIGFNCHLNLLARLVNLSPPKNRVIACHMGRVDEVQRLSIQRFLTKLRSKGDIVVCIFDDDIESTRTFTHEVVWEDQKWAVAALKTK